MNAKYTISVAYDYPQLDTPILKGQHWEHYAKATLKHFEQSIATRFGGFTRYKAQGAYTMQDHNNKDSIVYENSITYDIIANDDKTTRLEVLNSVSTLKENLYQESILLTITKLDQVLYV